MLRDSVGGLGVWRLCGVQVPSASCVAVPSALNEGKRRRVADAVIGHLVPRAAVEFASTRFRDAPAPLLEEERDARGHALVANVANPFGPQLSTSRTTFTADDDPINT